VTALAARASTADERVGFGVLNVAFDSRVLRPRPWTTMQSSWAAEIARSAPAGPILELCSGAGHIGLLAAVLCGRHLVQVDTNPTACRFARRNAEEAGVGDRVEIRCNDLGSALRLEERFPLILADPPYVPSADVARFPDDPRSAIDGGDSGLDLVVECLDVVSGHLLDGGSCLLQVRGASQAAAVQPLAGTYSLTVEDVRVVDDDRAVALLRAHR